MRVPRPWGSLRPSAFAAFIAEIAIFPQKQNRLGNRVDAFTSPEIAPILWIMELDLFALPGVA